MEKRSVFSQLVETFKQMKPGKVGDHSSFELPWRNAIWNYVMTKRTLTDAKHVHEAGVHLCAVLLVL